MKAIQSTFGALSLVVFLAAGCGKNKAVAATEEYAAKACACKDAKCAADATLAFDAKADELKDVKGSEADAKAIAAAGDKATACVAKFTPADPSAK